MTLLSVRNLRVAFRFEGRLSVPVRDVSFDIPENGRVALVGESGCGKSVTALALGGLVDRAEISGEIVGSPKIAYVFQNPMQSLNPVMRVGRQILEGVSFRRGGNDASTLLDAVGLPEDAARKYPCELSGGQQQRVMIAMALAQEPDLLIADEPTTALDVTTQREVLDLIARVADERKMSVLLITHNLGLVSRYSSFVNVMYAGTIVERGAVREILDSPRHPYTRGLIAAVPRLDAPKDAPLSDIPGTVPPPTDWPTGCAFHPRCPDATAACSHEAPVERPLAGAPGHGVRCLMRAVVFSIVATVVFCLTACAEGILPTMLSLDGEWRLDYFPQPDDGAVRTLPLAVPFETVKAEVPGNCELDLIRAGLLPPVETGLAARKLLPYEGYQWLYTRTFARPSVVPGERAVLRFEGVDTLADVFLNGEKIGETANMLIPHAFDVTKRMKEGENTVQVLLRSVRCEAQYATVGELGHLMPGGADGEPFRKAGHMGGWDIFPRIYCAGLWRGVSLEVQKPVRIDQTAWIVRWLGETRVSLDVTCRVQAPYRHLHNAELRYSLSRGGRTVAECRRPLDRYQNLLPLWDVDGIERWWPKGMGGQPLYEAKIEVVAKDGAVLAEHVERIGFRTIRLERDDIHSKERPGQFLFRVNGEPCYVRGANWVPLDAFPSRQAARIIPTLELFDDLNCNMVRVWGGGVYEPDAFFDYCDEHGLMVWQDFMTGCSVFPQDDAYAKATEEEVRAVVLRLRNRASLALWSGNNENDSAFGWRCGCDPNRDRSSRRTIPDVLFELDLTRDYLPSSPYRSPDVVAGRAQASEAHLWGERAYYKVPFYTNSPAWFASEMGYHGCPNLASLRRMMTKEAVYPWTRIVGTDPKTGYVWNDEWTFKASDPLVGAFGQRRNSLMTNQVKLMFGGVDTNLETFVEQSQVVQAEAMKTFCELFRSRKFTRFNGLVWWNVRDGWPQISDAVVDWYGGKKRAYWALRSVQRDQLVMLGDDHVAWAVNDRLHPVKGHATFTDKASGRVLLDRDYEVPANGKVSLGTVSFAGQGCIDIAYSCDGERLRNHFLYGEPPFKWTEVRDWLGEVDER